MQRPAEYKHVIHNKDLHMNWFVYMGEIPNMLGHCVVAGYTTGKLYSGLHIENFIELTEDEA